MTRNRNLKMEMRAIEGKSVGRFGGKKKRRKKEQLSTIEIVMQII